MRAVSLLRADPHYRADAFAAGLERLGYRMADPNIRDPGPDDLLLTWNLHNAQDVVADQWRAAGARVLVAENGYYGTDRDGHQLYAIARDGHNGSGRWYVGESTRPPILDLELGEYDARPDGWILVVGQRGIGSPSMRSPMVWHRKVIDRVQARWPRAEIRVREHPGQRADVRPVEADLAGARAVVVWSSAVGVAAIVRGLPVYFDAPRWICEACAVRLEDRDPVSLVARRLVALQRMSWAQWTLEEIGSGLPFRYLLDENLLLP